MKRVLVIGDSPNISTGFGRVTAAIGKELQGKHGWDCVFLGVNEQGEPNKSAFVVHRANLHRDTMGTNRVLELACRYKPDVIFMIGDLWNIRHWQAALLSSDMTDLIPRVCYFPIDGRWMNPEFTACLPNITIPVTYTEFGVEVVRFSAKVMGSRFIGQKVADLDLRVIGHGVDTASFYPVARDEARAFLNPMPDGTERSATPLTDEFIVLNANRNAERKRLDITIKAFVRFAAKLPIERRDKVRLWLHCDTLDQGHTGTLPLLFGQACIDHNISFRTQDGKCSLLMFTDERHRQVGAQGGEGGVSDTVLRMIYNACDVGLNTSSGEGWGLVTHEQAACRVPQIVGNHSASKELWAGVALTAAVAARYIDPGSGLEHCIVDETDVAAYLHQVYTMGPRQRELIGDDCYRVATQKCYSWDVIGDEWNEVLLRAVELRETPIFQIPLAAEVEAYSGQ